MERGRLPAKARLARVRQPYKSSSDSTPIPRCWSADLSASSRYAVMSFGCGKDARGAAAGPSPSAILFCFPLHRGRVGVLELQPIWRTPRSVTRSQSLRNNSLQPILQAFARLTRSRLFPGHRSNEYCIAQASAVIFSGCWTSNPEVDAMTRPECLKRAAECNRLAEATSDPDMKLYLMRLALTWMQSATEAEDKARKAA